MDMQDPSLVPGGETKDQTLNEAAATMAEAVTVTPDPEAAVEVEEIMAQGEADAELEAERQPDTDESLMAQALALLAKDASEISTDDIRRLRQHYSMLHKPAPAAEGEQAAEPMPENNEFTLIIERLKSKKAAWVAEQEAIKAANLERKNAIIDEINALAEDTDNVNRTFARYRELQDEFNAIGDVDPMQETSVWKRFQEAREHYSDNLKINKELRDYDFKKNLEDKEALLAEATALLADEDVIAAYRRLQDLHNKWRQIGPVAKELREDIWGRFREASTEINKRYQAFFEARKAREAENEAAKTELCQKIEAIDLTTLKTFAAWEETTRSIVALQEDWRKLGFASKKANRSLFARFRRACDAFFAAKAEFYRSTREELSANLAHKQQLVERAEALKDSTDWRAAADEFIAMQKEWKSIGAIPKKYSDALWARFTEACDYFFDQKKKAGCGTRAIEANNLKIKREIIGQLSALIEETQDKATAIEQLKALQQRWNETGHVPFREKDKLYQAYRSAVDAVRHQFDMAEKRANRERFVANVNSLQGDNDKLYHERERLVRALENRRNDLRTYENNLGFLSAKSKNGSSLLHDLERRIERLKADIKDIEDKIKILDEKL